MVPTTSLLLPIWIGTFLINDMVVHIKCSSEEAIIESLLKFLGVMKDANPNNQFGSAYLRKADIWKFDLTSRKCQEPRDRIYSLLAVANATDFEVNYIESTYATFWRAAEYFNVWHEPWKLMLLWRALELNGKEFLSTVKMADGQQVQCSIAARLSGVITQSGVSTCNRARRRDKLLGAKLKSPVSEGDVLLCASTWRYGLHQCRYLSPHFVLRSDDAGGKDSFIIAMYLERDHLERRFDFPAFCLQDAELWFRVEDVETKIVSWKQLMMCVVKIAKIFDDSTSGFTLKSSPSYILASLGLYDSWGTTTADVLERFDRTLKDVEVNFLPSNAGG